MPAEYFEFAVVGGGKGGKTLAAKRAADLVTQSLSRGVDGRLL